jgi:hypothetical protein
MNIISAVSILLDSIFKTLRRYQLITLSARSISIDNNFTVHTAQYFNHVLIMIFCTISGFGDQYRICNFLAVGQTHFQIVRRRKLSIIQNPHNLPIGPNFRLHKNLRRFLYVFVRISEEENY